MLMERSTKFHGPMLSRYYFYTYNYLDASNIYELYLIYFLFQVFMPINEKDKHWFVARFHIKSGVVTFYDSGYKHEPEWRDWYLKMRARLEVKLYKCK